MNTTGARPCLVKKKIRNLEQEMRQNNVVFVFARGEKFRQNILIPDFHSLRKTDAFTPRL